LDAEEDTADITMEEATSTQQSINVNAESSYEAVPVEYMNCNAAAFEEGDSVLVEFTDQDKTMPKVIGFKEEPQSCEFRFTLTRGDGVPIDDTLGLSFTIFNSEGESADYYYQYDSDLGTWIITFAPSYEVCPDGYYVWYQCEGGTLKTLYPGIYKPSEGVNDDIPPTSSLIQPGDYEDTIPIWVTSDEGWIDTITGVIDGYHTNVGYCSSLIMGNPGVHIYNSDFGEGSILLITAGLTATKRITVKSSIPFRVARTVHHGPSGIRGWYYSSEECYMFGQETCVLFSGNQSAIITGGELSINISNNNPTDVTDYTYEEPTNLVSEANFDIEVESTSPSSLTHNCYDYVENEFFTVGVNFVALRLNSGNIVFDIEAEYDY